MKNKENIRPVTGEDITERKRKAFERFKYSGNVIRLGVIVLLIGFGGFLLWSALAPLDEGVPCDGSVTVSTKSKVVEHLHGGIVQAVHVHEGAMVEEGALLLTLTNEDALARYREVYERYLVLRATEGRLDAEERGAGRIIFHKDVVGSPDAQHAASIMENQRALFAARVDLVHALRQRLIGVKAMVADGYMTMYQQLELEERLADLDSQRASERADIQMQVDAFEKKTLAMRDQLKRRELRSPASGQVVGLKVQTVGAVITPGETVMEIVPLDESLMLEVHVAPQLIDRISTGLPADVRFYSFAHSPMMMVDGVVESVSHDLLFDQSRDPRMPGASYYLARISLTREGMQSLGTHRLQAGMPVQVVIKTGERSLLTYLLHPLMQRMSASLKEE